MCGVRCAVCGVRCAVCGVLSVWCSMCVCSCVGAGNCIYVCFEYVLHLYPVSSAQSLAISLCLPLLFNLSVFIPLKIIGWGWGAGGCVFQGAPPPSTDVIHYWYKGEGRGGRWECGWGWPTSTSTDGGQGWEDCCK